MSRSTQTFRFTAILIAFAFVGCSTAPKGEGAKTDLKDEAQIALNHFKREDPGLSDLLAKSVGYAMYPNVGKGGAIVGGAYGHGIVFQGDQPIGYTDLRQGSVGLQLGGQGYSELLVFNSDDAFNKFKDGKM